MPETIEMTAWTSLLLGLFSLFAGIGGLRNPQAWRTMVEEMQRSTALMITIAMVELSLGAVIYLANPWAPGDLLGVVMKVIGGIMMIEALAMAAWGDVFLGFWLRIFGGATRAWAILSVVIGLVLTVSGALRFS